MQKSALDVALDYAGRGWYVFPIQPNTKYPYKDFKWKDLSTSDPEIITATSHTEKYKDCNWAVDAGKSGLLILDADTYKEHFEGLKIATPDTFAVKTARGGSQYYFDDSAGIGKNSAEKFAPAIDTRGAGGYALIPGSVFDNKPYTILKDVPLEPIPPVLHEFCTALPSSEKKEDRDVPVVDLDTDADVSRATAYLQQAQIAIEGQGGNDQTFQVACRLRDLGVSEEKSLELMLEHYNEKCEPPWDSPELERVIRNANKYAKDRPGNASVETIFPDPLRSTSAIRCAADTQLENIKPREWLLGYRYIPGYVTLTIAPGGVGKSLLTILEGMSIASGKQLTFDEVHVKGPVWLYNTEDPFEELDRRVMAAAKHHGLSKKDLSDFFYSSGYDKPLKLVVQDKNGPPMENSHLVDSVIKQIKQRNVRLFIVDPFVECHSVNENDNMAISMVVQVFRRIAKETSCAISLVHHTSKGKALHGDMDKSRGASALVSAARIAHTLYPMSAKEGADYAVTPGMESWYVRLDDAKANLAPPGGGISWYKKESVKLFFDNEETTGTLKPVALERIEAEDVDQLMTEIALTVLQDGVARSMHGLAQEVNNSGLFTKGVRTIQRRMEGVFTETIVVDGKTYRPVKVNSRNGGLTNGVVCGPEDDLLKL